MANEIITTLHPDQDPDTNLYPNIKGDNIPSKSVNRSKLDDSINSLLDSINELHPSGVDTSTNILAYTTNKGIYIGSNNGKWYYWDGTHYVEGGTFVSSGSLVTLTDLENALKYISYIPKSYNLNSVTFGESINAVENILFKNNEIVCVSNGTSYEGLRLECACIGGRTLHIACDRSGGNSFKIRLRCFDVNNTEVKYKLITGSGDLLEVIPSSAVKMEIIFGICWGTPLTSLTSVTFSDVLIEYIKEIDDVLSLSSTNPVQNKILTPILNDCIFRSYNSGDLEFTNMVNNSNNILFSCDNIKMYATTSSYQGVQLILTKFIKNKYLHLKANRNVTGSTFAYRFVLFDSNNTQIGYKSTGYDGDDISIYISENVSKIEVTIASKWNSTLSEGTEVNFSNILLYYDNGIKSSFGDGEFKYFGKEKLSIKYNDYLMKYTDEKIINQEDWTTLTSQVYGSNQSLAIFGDWVFIINDGAQTIVFNKNDYTTAYTFDLPNTYHHNSAQFLDVYYDPDDQFPLLMISNCEYNINQASVSIVRIIKTGDVFTSSLIKTINFDITSMKNYGFSCVYNYNTKKLIAFYNLNGDWQVTTNNPVVISEFDQPDWLDPNTLTYSSTDEKIIKYYDFFVVQGMTYFNDKIYIAVETPNNNTNYWGKYFGLQGSFIFVFNSNYELLNMIKTYHNEPEGVAISNDGLYLSSRVLNSGGSNIDVFWLTKFEF